jgi:exodeoxyribonuclease-3
VRIVTLNMNGIRAAHSKGFPRWFLKQDADVLCLQEVKARSTELAPEVRVLHGYHGFYHDAEKKGYSGVALHCRKTPSRVRMGLGWPDFDAEGRFVQADFDGLSVCSLYIPSGTTGEPRQQVKYAIMDRLAEWLAAVRREAREYIICGDWNIAHRPMDLKNWRSNQKSSGFLPEERAWLDKVFDDLGFVDAFRVVNREADQYTWWSNRGQAWAKNVGWRIDYQVITPGLAERVRCAAVYKEERFSDHAPLTLDYDLAP